MREHEIEDDQIGLFAAGARYSSWPVGSGGHAETVLYQVIAGQAHDLGFVIYNQNEFGHRESIKEVSLNEKEKEQKEEFCSPFRSPYLDLLTSLLSHHSNDDFSTGMPRAQMTHRLPGLTELVLAVYDRGHLSGLDKLAQHRKVLSVEIGYEEN